jgi:hypothetical protein
MVHKATPASSKICLLSLYISSASSPRGFFRLVIIEESNTLLPPKKRAVLQLFFTKRCDCVFLGSLCAAGSFFSANLLINFRQWIFFFFQAAYVLKKKSPTLAIILLQRALPACRRDKISFSPLA